MALDWVPGRELDDPFVLKTDRTGLCDVIEASGTVVEADQVVVTLLICMLVLRRSRGHTYQPFEVKLTGR